MQSSVHPNIVKQDSHTIDDRVFLTRGMGKVLPPAKNLLTVPPPGKISLSRLPPQKVNPPSLKNNFNVITQ